MRAAGRSPAAVDRRPAGQAHIGRRHRGQSAAVHAALQRTLGSSDTEKDYLALVGRLKQARGQIDLRLGRDPADRRQASRVDAPRRAEPHAIRTDRARVLRVWVLTRSLQACHRPYASDPRTWPREDGRLSAIGLWRAAVGRSWTALAAALRTFRVRPPRGVCGRAPMTKERLFEALFRETSGLATANLRIPELLRFLHFGAVHGQQFTVDIVDVDASLRQL